MLKKNKQKNIPAVWKNSAKGSKRGQEKKKKTATEPDVDLTPMHIPCISGDISKPQIYKRSTM